MDPYQTTSDIFKLMGDRNRLMILALLKENGLCVCEIVGIMKMSQPNVSQHMRKLKAGGLVKETKKGQWVYYTLQDNPVIIHALNWLPSVKNKITGLNTVEQRERCL